MREQRVEFFSEGVRLVGLLRQPDGDAGPRPAIVHGPGWLGLAGAKTYLPWHTAFVEAGYAVLAFDYRGWGESDGERGWILPHRQVEDIVNAVTYLCSREDIHPRRIGAYGMGGIGGGNAIVAAAIEDRIGCVAVQSVVADGSLWLQRMRREYEWVDFRRRVEQDARRWVLEGTSELVNPRTDIMVSTPERANYRGKKDVDGLVEPQFHLQSAAAVMRFRPIDYVDRLSPRGLLLTCVEDDSVTPESHAVELFERAGEPKRLVRQSGTTHYASYQDNYARLAAEIVGWYETHLDGSLVQVRDG